MDREGIKAIIKQNPELADKLFCRGFLFTNADVDLTAYPFYGKWKHTKMQYYHMIVSPKQKSYFVTEGDATIVLVGHAYNPFTMEIDENTILAELIKQYSEESISMSSSLFWEKINELTGIFTIIIIDQGSVLIIGDASGMQTTFYTINSGKIYVASHTNLIGDLLDLDRDPYVVRLKNYRFFKLLGNALPGNLTQFSKVKRLIPNHYV